MACLLRSAAEACYVKTCVQVYRGGDAEFNLSGVEGGKLKDCERV